MTILLKLENIGKHASCLERNLVVRHGSGHAKNS